MHALVKLGSIVAAFAMSISACSFVGSKQMVGNEPVNPDVSNGSSWVDSNGDVMTITFDDKEPGRLHLTSSDEDTDEMIGYLRTTGDWLFLNFALNPEESEVEGWLWCVAKLSDDGKNVFLWMPNTDDFAKLVRAETVKGSVEETESEEKVVLQPDGTKRKVASLPSVVVTIDAPKGQWVEDLVSGKLGVPIEWQNPILWRRVEANAEGRPDSDSPMEAEQASTGQPATRPESDFEGGDKPQPES